MTTRPIDTVLIANRGEIACRIIRTCRLEKVRSVAVYTDLDSTAPHVKQADEAVRIESYLDIDAVVAAAKQVGAQAVHPGYGFLSERSEFARALEGAGLKLVGPSAAVMDAMGRKDKAREIAVAAGVPVVPSYTLEDEDGAETHIPETDYPVLVKAAAGGGGKGMRVVRSAAELADALDGARREAAKAFGDDTLLIEKYVESGRHIEVQVFADAHGNVVHLYERDCSTQRRHQKVLEEAPAPTLTAEQRELVTSSAVALAKQVGYENAGTVEFLLDNATGAAYFLEMNTRLQVEHPVTEEVIRVHQRTLDLVALQLRIAAGEPIGFTQAEVQLEGHAIEARVYAEDSFGGFLPQAGEASEVRWPDEYDGRGGGLPVRVDHALESGQTVTTAFDPMLGKVIAWGEDREMARRLLISALSRTTILGLTTNVGFLRALLSTEEFAEARADTAWLDHHQLADPGAAEARILAALAEAPTLLGGQNATAPTAGPWAHDGWRQGGSAAPALIALDRVVACRPGLVDDVPVTVLGSSPDLNGNGLHLRVTIGEEQHEGHVSLVGNTVEVLERGQRHVFELPDPFADHADDAGDGSILSPMPGTVLAVRIAEGDAVEEGQVLGVLEAMKMELTLKAPFPGIVSVVACAAGDLVQLGAVLFEVSTGSLDQEAER